MQELKIYTNIIFLHESCIVLCFAFSMDIIWCSKHLFGICYDYNGIFGQMHIL